MPSPGGDGAQNEEFAMNTQSLAAIGAAVLATGLIAAAAPASAATCGCPVVRHHPVRHIVRHPVRYTRVYQHAPIPPEEPQYAPPPPPGPPPALYDDQPAYYDGPPIYAPAPGYWGGPGWYGRGWGHGYYRRDYRWDGYRH